MEVTEITHSHLDPSLQGNHVMADQSTGLVVQGTPLAFHNSYAPVFSQDLPAGTPIYLNANGQAQAAVANGTFAQARCAGIAVNAGNQVGVENPVQYAGGIQLTEAQWNAVIQGGGTTGLTPGATYWVSDTTAGTIVATPPSTEGHWDTAVLTAITNTIAVIIIGAPNVGGSA
jgi:hypothetical protein